MKLLRILLSIQILWLSGIASAQESTPLTVDDLIDSIKEYHPLIKSAQARREQADVEGQRAQGAFDLQLNQTTQSRLSGFYDGQYFDQSVTKPLQYGGLEVSAGYRISSGIFPIYEDFFNTQSAGEASLGLKVPLLRGRETDSRRTALENADSLQNLGLTQEKITINELIFQGVNTYINWYQAYQRNLAVAALVELAETRRDGIEERVANGDLAAITITEFETTLLSRQITLRETEQNLLQAQQQLLFYWRDNDGQSPAITELVLPELPIEWPFTTFSFDNAWQQSLINSHPTLDALDERIRVAENQSRLARNNLLPKFDVDVKVGRDMGSGSVTLDRPESYIGLSFSMPLQRNRAKADEQSAQSEIRELRMLRAAQVDRLRLQLNENLLQLNTYDQLRQLRQQQAEIAKELENQEHARFDAGDSDQFLLNARESQAAQAALDAIDAEVVWVRQQLNLISLSFDLMEL